MKPKRAISLLLAGCMAVSMVPASAVTAFAETVGNAPALAVLAQNAETHGDCGAEGHESEVKWSFDGATGVLSITGNGPMADYVVSDDSTEDDRPWKSFAGDITEVKIAEGITRIGNSVFRGMNKLISANIPASVTSLGNYIFRGDKELITVTWADGFVAPETTDTDSNTATYTGTYVPVSMFDFCEKLGQGKELTEWLPKSFTGVSCAAFRGTQFKIDFDKWNNLTYIGARAFEGMPKLSGFTLTDGIQVGLRGGDSNAFIGSGLKQMTIKAEKVPQYFATSCKELTKVTLENSKVEIASNAFVGTGLTSLNVPSGTEVEINESAFADCKNLKEVTFGSNSKATLKDATFSGDGIEKFTVAEGAEVSVEDNPFRASNNSTRPTVSSLKELNLSGKLESRNGATYTLWGNMFAPNTDLKEINISGENLQYVSTQVFPRMETLNVKGGAATITEGYLYSGNTALKHINIDVDSYAERDANGPIASFRNAQELQTFVLKAQTVHFGNRTFVECPKIEMIDLTGCDNITYESGCFGSMPASNYPCSPMNNSAIIYVDSESNNPRISGVDTGLSNSHGIVMVTNGGIVDMNATGFDSVIRAGYTATWYEDAACTQKTKDATPQVGKTYYAKWSQNASMDAETDQKGDSQTATVTVGKPIEVTVTVNPGDNMLAILRGKARITFTDPTAVESLSCNGKTYTGKELADANYTLNVSDLMPGSDAGSSAATYAATTAYPSAKLSIVFNKKGNQTVKIQLLDSDDNLLCESNTVVAVEEEKKPEETKPDDTKPENPVTTYALTVKGGTVKVNDKDAVANDGVIAVEKDAKVEVTFDKSTLSDAQVFDLWSITPDSVLNAVDPHTETIRFTMPAEKVTIEAMTRDATIESEGPGVLGTAALIGVAGAGAAVVGYQGYMIGTELYLNTVLPDGVAIPQNTAELAKLVWTEAGKPAPAAVMAPDATDEQKALTWAIENQLISADKAADASVSRWEVIQTWNKAQEMKG